MFANLLLGVLLLGHGALAYGLYRQMQAHHIHLHPVLWLPVLLIPYLGGTAVALVYWRMYSREDFQALVVSQVDEGTNDVTAPVSEEEAADAVTLQESEDVRQWVPVEEALLLNEAPTKRALVMTILKDQPENVVALLQQARMNDDVEVVHYATVMLAELHKGYDTQLQDLKQALLKRPDDVVLLEATCQLLEAYLQSGLVVGKFAESSRRQYIDLLRRKVAISHEMKDYLRLGRQYLALGEQERLRQIMDYGQVQWPLEEDYRMFQLQALVAQGDQAGLARFYHEIKRLGVYFSRHNRAIIQFWETPRQGGLDHETLETI